MQPRVRPLFAAVAPAAVALALAACGGAPSQAEQEESDCDKLRGVAAGHLASLQALPDGGPEAARKLAAALDALAGSIERAGFTSERAASAAATDAKNLRAMAIAAQKAAAALESNSLEQKQAALDAMEASLKTGPDALAALCSK
jgi:hypothetical protein